MNIFGHPWIDSKKFYQVTTKEEINQTPPNSIILLEKLKDSIELALYCKKNSLECAVKVSSIKDAIFANKLEVKYIISKPKDAIQIQPIAQNYLFDTEILAMIEDENEIEKLAPKGIDGVIFKKEL
jgi:hypothetical protein